VLRGWLSDLGLDPDEDVMYSNVHDQYHPEAPSYVPSTKECKEGYARLAEEFSLVPSLRCVVLLGGPAAHMVFGGRMGEMHGRQGSIGVGSAAAEGVSASMEDNQLGQRPLAVALPASIPVLACYHPGFFWHSKGAKARAAAENEILSVLRKAVDIVNGESTELELPVPEYAEEVIVT